MVKILTVNLPDIGEGVVEGEVIEWLKNVGDRVAQDEAVVVVMTDKATVELPSPYPGILNKQYFGKGEIALVHHPLYDIEAEGEQIQVKQEQAAPKAKQEEIQKKTPIESEKTLATPAVRHLAKQLGVDLGKVVPTGTEGQVTVDDVKSHIEVKPKYPYEPFSDDIIEPISGIRALMEGAMTQSHELIPHFSYFEQLDVTGLKKRKEEYKTKVTLMPFYIYALSQSLKEVPLANSSYNHVERKIYQHIRHNIGIAMDTPYGLIVPVLKGVEKMDLAQVVEAYDALKQKAKSGTLASSDMKEATITITNFGTLGGFAGTPIIPLPNVAILGLGKIEAIPSVVDGTIQAREKQMICWSFDHRLIDGALAAKLSSTFTNLLI